MAAIMAGAEADGAVVVVADGAVAVVTAAPHTSIMHIAPAQHTVPAIR